LKLLYLNPMLQRVRDERQRQIAKFGDQRQNDNMEWTAILAEEMGEAAKAALDSRPGTRTGYATEDELQNELIQTAAVAIAWAEALEAKFAVKFREDQRNQKRKLLSAPRQRIVEANVLPDEAGIQTDKLECGHIIGWRRSKHPQPTSHHCWQCQWEDEQRTEQKWAMS
jgi:NTP pyrophosphatase (non-canonical NTP hydrolase)